MDGWESVLYTAACVVAVTGVVIIVFAGFLKELECIFVPEESGIGTVKAKWFLPHYEELRILTEATEPQLAYVLDTWSLSIAVGKQEATVSVPPSIFEQRRIGERVPVKFRRGRFTGLPYLTSIC